jgi:hypothetical protein
MSLQHATAESCKESFQELVNNGMESSRWFGIVFTIDEEGRLHMSRTTCNFPHDKLHETVRMLKEAVVQELELDTSPLPLAPGFPIFNAEEEQEEQDDDDNNNGTGAD